MSSEEFKAFCMKYKGAIIGGLIAIIIACTGLYKLLIALVIIGAGIWAGNYIQRHKEEVKETLKKFIDKF